MGLWTFTSLALVAAMTGFTQAAAGVAGILNVAKLKLFVNDVNPGPNAVIGDFTLASFTGSAPVTIAAWGEAFVDALGAANILGTLAQWNWTALGPETVYGVVLTDSADGLLAYSRFTTPKDMEDASDSLAVVPRFQLGTEGFGSPIRVSEI